MNSNAAPRRPISSSPPAATQSTQSAAALEQLIADALRNGGTAASEDLMLLIGEVETAVVAAEQAATTARSQAVDLVASPDADAAHKLVLSAELGRDRLRAALPRLRQLLGEAQAREYAERWDARYRRVRTVVEEAAETLRRYPALVAELIGLLKLAAEVDNEVSAVIAQRPTTSVADWLALS